ncbi:unnamed protein product [Ectocarpus sp. 6 AP-2014]
MTSRRGKRRRSMQGRRQMGMMRTPWRSKGLSSSNGPLLLLLLLRTVAAAAAAAAMVVGARHMPLPPSRPLLFWRRGLFPLLLVVFAMAAAGAKRRPGSL